MEDPNQLSAVQQADAPLLDTLFDQYSDDICPFGDIVLVAHDGCHPRAKIRVSSCILAMASEVWKKMFSERWSCSKSISASLREIEVEDDPTTLTLLCRVLHHKPPRASESDVESELDLLALAVLAEYYDCINAIRTISRGLIEAQLEALKTSTGKDVPSILFRLAAAAYIFDQPQQFRSLTRSIVVFAEGISKDSFPAASQDFIPAELVHSLVAQRTCARQQLTYSVDALIRSFGEEALERKCPHVAYKFVEHLEEEGLFPTAAPGELKSILELINALEDVEIPVLRRDPLICSCSDLFDMYSLEEIAKMEPKLVSQPPYVHVSKCEVVSPRRIFDEHPGDTVPSYEWILEASQNTRDICVGVCLDCIKAKAAGLTEYECRVAHPRPWEISGRLDETRNIIPGLDCFLVYEDREADFFEAGTAHLHELVSKRPHWWQDEW